MGRFLRTQTNKILENAVWEKFLAEIKKMSSSETDRFLNRLLSPEEKIILSRRLATISLIRDGKKYREISEILGSSARTVSAIKKSLSGSFYESQSKTKRNYSKQKQSIPPLSLFDEIGEIFSKMPSYKGVGQSRFRKAKRK